MDTGDLQDAVPKQGTGPKGKKKKKEGKKTLSLDQFLQSSEKSSSAGNWAMLTEPDDESETPIKFDRSTLPTAPKAAMGPKYNEEDIPRDGPFSAHLGNVSYDAREMDLENFFGELNILQVRLITDNGRPRGYAYVDFKTREDLIEALTYHERDFMGRPIRVDLATSKDTDGRSNRDFGSRSHEPDRTDGDWRRRGPPEEPSGGRSGFDRDRGSGFGDRERDRGGFGDRDRDRGGFGDRDRGGFGDRDRDRGGFGDRDRDRGGFGDRDRDRGGFGDRDRDRGGFGDRDRDRGGFGDRDRDRGGFGDRDRDRGGFGDRDRGYGDRDRGGGFGDRDRGFGDRDRDRGFGGDRGYGGDRDRGYGGDRERSNRGYGFNRDRDDGGRYGGSRDDRYGGRRDDYGGRRDDYGGGRRDDYPDRRPSSREGSSEAPKSRPKLKLQPRSKPTDNKENEPAPVSRPSIFGAAKPVDTAAREKQIEEKLKKAPVADDNPRSRQGESDDQGRWRRRDERHSGGRQQNDSESSSENRHDKEEGEGEEPKSPPPPTKMMPAPPPKENAWAKKEGSLAVASAAAPSSSAERGTANSTPSRSNTSNNAVSSSDRQQGNAWGRGKAGPRSEGPPGRRPGGERTNGSYNGPARGPESGAKRQPREKHLPQSLDEMPKYEEKAGKDFSDQNKFAFLEDEDPEVDEDARDDRDRSEPAESTATS